MAARETGEEEGSADRKAAVTCMALLYGDGARGSSSGSKKTVVLASPPFTAQRLTIQAATARRSKVEVVSSSPPPPSRSLSSSAPVASKRRGERMSRSKVNNTRRDVGPRTAAAFLRTSTSTAGAPRSMEIGSSSRPPGGNRLPMRIGAFDLSKIFAAPAGGSNGAPAPPAMNAKKRKGGVGGDGLGAPGGAEKDDRGAKKRATKTKVVPGLVGGPNMMQLLRNTDDPESVFTESIHELAVIRKGKCERATY